jgi:hypothetical protein
MTDDPAERSWLGRLILVAWFLRIVKPEWIISHYIPSLGFIKGIPTLFILAILIGILIGNRRIRWEWRIGLFLLIAAISTFFSANRGISIQVVRGISELWILAAATLTYHRTQKEIKIIYGIYEFAFICFGIWGILGKGKVTALLPLNNEDGFGPFMCMGISFNYFLSFTVNTWKSKVLRVAQYICILGVVVSFARGTFLSLIAVILYMILRTRRRTTLILQMIILGIIGITFFSFTNPAFIKTYTDEMSTIWEQGQEEGTAKDRVFLWTKGLEMFRDNFLFGVGPDCYGFRLPLYTSVDELAKWGLNTQVFNRAIHNIFIQILAEMGLFGFIGFLIILAHFKKTTNILIRVREVKSIEYGGNANIYDGNLLRNYRFTALALEGGMVAYLINGLFYNTLFTTWLWDLLILNALLYKKVLEIKAG